MLFQRFAAWVCSWAGHCRDWPAMEECGRCGVHMPLPDDFFAHSEDEEPEACPHCNGDGMDPLTDYLFECPHCLGDKMP